ncbi:hypothetical protein BKA82DRAFT_992247 [Pisolithus tinctorius]|uniref:Uncharacterized protein n=1 Tax=Pisolithus tinctorius Marx 270 TaxID=870435 RepID=A0A0C3PIN3_PISTI|nr:hypothetical protein BKA82DRAFT_992247 [Pisolithus tinctorius]KIO13985.1 hypothetical protein M404DRAFT_992247 [Pisolithus tinctorius Marx 270]
MQNTYINRDRHICNIVPHNFAFPCKSDERCGGIRAGSYRPWSVSIESFISLYYPVSLASGTLTQSPRHHITVHVFLMLLCPKTELKVWAAALNTYDEQEFLKSIELFSRFADSSKILTNMGLIYATIGEHEVAIEYFNAATNLDEFLAIAYIDIFNTYLFLMLTTSSPQVFSVRRVEFPPRSL